MGNVRFLEPEYGTRPVCRVLGAASGPEHRRPFARRPPQSRERGVGRRSVNAILDSQWQTLLHTMGLPVVHADPRGARSVSGRGSPRWCCRRTTGCACHGRSWRTNCAATFLRAAGSVRRSGCPRSTGPRVASSGACDVGGAARARACLPMASATRWSNRAGGVEGDLRSGPAVRDGAGEPVVRPRQGSGPGRRRRTVEAGPADITAQSAETARCWGH